MTKHIRAICNEEKSILLVKAMSADGKTDKQISKRLECSIPTIWKIRKNHGISSGTKSRMADTKDTARKMRDEGYTYAQIGEWLCVTKSRAHQILHQDSA